MAARVPFSKVKKGVSSHNSGRAWGVALIRKIVGACAAFGIG